MDTPTYDYVIIGSGFGGSVSALRLTEKGYHVLVLERGKRFRDQDFAQRNWTVWKYLWVPALRWFGILQISPFRNVLRAARIGRRRRQPGLRQRADGAGRRLVRQPRLAAPD